MKKKIKKEWKPDGYLKSAIRKIWRWSPQRRECLKSAYCYYCKRKRKLLADHKIPVVDPERGFFDWNTYIDRMFNGELQPLCKDCHNEKSRGENARRRKAKKERMNGQST